MCRVSSVPEDGVQLVDEHAAMTHSLSALNAP